GRYRRHPHTLQRTQHTVHPVFICQRVFLLVEGAELRDVSAGRKRTPAGAYEHDSSDRRVRVDLKANLADPVVHGEREGVARPRLGVVEDLVVGLDLSAGHARLLQQRYPMSPRLARRHLFDHRDQEVPARVARRVVLETFLACPLRVVEHIAERPPVAWSRRADGEEAVGRADRLIRGRGLVGRTQWGWNLSGREVAPCLPNLERYSGLEERHVDELAAAGLFAYAQRRERADRAIKGADQIADRHADFDRVAIELAGDGHQPAHRL